jgi:hypothetical protein
MAVRGLWLLGVALGSVLISACNVADVQFTNTPVPTLSGVAGDFDVVEIDQQDHRLYAADRTKRGVDVFDISKAHAAYLQTIPLPSNPNGLAIAPDLGRLFAGTSAGSVVIIDLKSTSPTRAAVIKVVTTSGGTDLLDYAAARHQLFVGGSDGSITSVDAATGDIKGHFKVGYGLEQPRFNQADGMLYVSSPDANALLRIDPNDGTIKNKFPLPKCHPSGMAIDPRSNQALIACERWVMSWDFRTGKAQVFDQVAGGDIVSYDAKVDRFLVAAPRNKPASAVGIFGANPIAFIKSVVTTGGGNSASYDETNNLVYTPDTRLNMAGVTSFRPPPDDQFSTALVASFGVLALLMAVVGVLLFVVARSADPIRRPLALPKPATAAASRESSGAHT